MCLVHGDLKFVGSFKPPYPYVVLNCDAYQTNILVDDDNHARVADVGLSTIVGPSFDRSVASNNSARWMAPELVADLNAEETPGPTTKSDVFSFGRLIYAARVSFFSTIHARTDLYVYAIGQVSTKREPLQHMRSDVAVVLFLQSERQPPRPQAKHCDGAPMSDALWQLTLDCWKSAPDERPDMSAIVHRLQLLK
jgi:serine/threonine protein kinase